MPLRRKGRVNVTVTFVSIETCYDWVVDEPQVSYQEEYPWRQGALQIDYEIFSMLYTSVTHQFLEETN